MKNRLLTLLLLSAMAPGLRADEAVIAAAGFAFPSVQEAGSARAIGLGSTYVGIADGSASLLWNPAGLGNLMRPEFGLHHNSALVGAIQEIFVLGLPLGYKNGLGLTVNYESNGIFEGRDANGLMNGDYSSSAFGVGAGWGMALPGGVSVGLGLKVNSQDLAGTAYTAFAGDAGVLWSMSPELTLGAAYTNLGPPVQGRQLAQGLRLGVSSILEKGSNYQWLLALSGESLTYGEQSIHMGVEHTLYQFLALRGGYAFNVPNPQAAGLLGWTFGGGVRFNDLTLDYAFVPLADLGNMQRVSLTLAFGDARKTAMAAQAAPAAAVQPTEISLVLDDRDFVRVVPGGEAELLSKAAEGRLDRALNESKGDGAYLRVTGKTDIKAPNHESHEMTEIGKRRGNLVRNYLVKHAPPARVVTEVTSGARDGRLGGIFQVVVR